MALPGLRASGNHDASKSGPSANGRNTFTFGGADWTRFLDEEVVPRLTVESVFTHEAHNFQRSGDKVRGGCPWHESKSGSSFYVNLPELVWRCPACGVGGGPLQYRWRLAGNTTLSPRGRDFIDAVRNLAKLAGVTPPESNTTEEEKEISRRRETRRAVLESVVNLCEKALWTKHGEQARAYLLARGFAEEDLRELRVGLYPKCEYLENELGKQGHTNQDITESYVLFEKMIGYTTWPWNDDAGRLLTIYGKLPIKPPPGVSKTMALPNAKSTRGVWELTKRSPLYFDRARKAGHKELVLVEGPTDAALPQLRGDSRVIASVAAELSDLQVKTLKHHGVRSVIIALDPDAGGDGGILSCTRQLMAVGIRPYVAPTFPDGLDPDEFFLREGLDGWKAHINRAVHAYRHLARRLAEAHGDRQPGDDLWLDDLIEKAVAFAEKQPEGSAADLKLHFWPEIAAATGVSADDLVARVKSQAQPEEPDATKDGDQAQSSPLCLIDSATFAATDYPIRWHIKKVLVRGQPALVSGPKKCLKTSLLCDLAISIGAGKPFLGVFESTGPTRIGFFSGESGPQAIKSTALHVCAAKGICLADAGVWWSFALPQLSCPQHLAILADEIRKNKLEAVVLDPLYLCLLAGNPNAQASNLYDMGPLLATVSETCLKAGATPILCHHFIKRPADPFGIPELEDMAGAGVAEFARQWVLIGRREPFEPGTGLHKLWLNVGGSAGFSSCWSVDVDEGVLADDFTGRKWEAFVDGASATIAGQKDQATRKREVKQQNKEKGEDAKVLNALDTIVNEGETPTCTKVRNRAGMNSEKFGIVRERLIAANLIVVEAVPMNVGGTKSIRTVDVMRRKSSAPAS